MRMNRRAFLAAAPAALAPVAAMLPAVAQATAVQTPEELIAHHLSELVRLLRETAPEGLEVMYFSWTDDLGPEAPEDFMVTAKDDRRTGHFRPRYRETWWLRGT